MRFLTDGNDLIRHLTESLLGGEHLDEREARALLGVLTDDDVPHAVKGALLGAMRVKGETADEVRGLADAMRERATRLPRLPDGVLVDTCGTGGDGSCSVNLSTATALVAAAADADLFVAKHGNRSVSSRSGSADVLEALGVVIPSTPEAAADQLAATGFTFLFAPLFHAATKAVVPVRRAIGARTVFNLLGPLTNPARPHYQLIGAYSESAARLLASALAGLGAKRAFVVHGAPGWDEATPVGPFVLFDVRDGRTERTIVDPLDHGVPRCTAGDLRGGDPADNAQALTDVLGGRVGPHADAVALNAGLVFLVAGVVDSLSDGVERARSVLARGAALGLLDRLRATVTETERFAS